MHPKLLSVLQLMRVLEMLLFASQGREGKCVACQKDGNSESCLSFIRGKKKKKNNPNVSFLFPACCGCKWCLGLLPGNWGKLPIHPKDGDLPWCLEETLEAPTWKLNPHKPLLDPESRRKGLPTGRCYGVPRPDLVDGLLASEPQAQVTPVYLRPTYWTGRSPGSFYAGCYWKWKTVMKILGPLSGLSSESTNHQAMLKQIYWE